MGLYVRLFTDALTDARVLSVSGDGFAMWCKGLLYAKHHGTDGAVPHAAIPIVGVGVKNAKKTIAELLRVGLWVEAPDGYTVGKNRWERHQESNEEIERKRAEHREAMRQWRAHRAIMQGARDDPVTNHWLITEPPRDGSVMNCDDPVIGPVTNHERACDRNVISSDLRPQTSDLRPQTPETTSPTQQEPERIGLVEENPPLPPLPDPPRKKPRRGGANGSAADGPATPNGVGLCIATWEARFGKGSAPGGRIGKAVKPLLQHHPPERVAAALEIYLGQDKAPEFLSVEKFATTFADWDHHDTDPFAIASRLPHSWRCRSPDTCETDGFHRSKPHEIPTDRHCTTPRADPTEARCPTAIAK